MIRNGAGSPIKNQAIPWFSVSTQVDDGVAFVSVSGELDLATRPVLVDSVHCHDGQYERVVFDLGELDFMDVAGFRGLLECTREKREISIRRVSPAARYLLRLLRQEDLIEGLAGSPNGGR